MLASNSWWSCSSSLLNIVRPRSCAWYRICRALALWFTSNRNLVGHQGIVKTKALIRAHVWYPGIDNQVERLVQSCRACQSNVVKLSFEPMKPSKMPEGPWRKISRDFFGPMEDRTYYFVNHDEYSRWASVEATKFTAFAKRWNFTHQKITPLWPRAKNQRWIFHEEAERVIRTAKVIGSNKKEALISECKREIGVAIELHVWQAYIEQCVWQVRMRVAPLLRVVVDLVFYQTLLTNVCNMCGKYDGWVRVYNLTPTAVWHQNVWRAINTWLRFRLNKIIIN